MAIVFTRSPRTSSITGTIILASVAAWLIQWLTGQTTAFTLLFGFVPALAIDQNHLWQPVSHLFVHTGFFQLLITMLVLHAFGRPLEQRLGKIRFVAIFVLAGAGAALLGGLTATGAARLVPVTGAAAAVIGMGAACIRIFPRTPIPFFWFLPVRAWSLLAFFIVFELLNDLDRQFDPSAFLVRCSGIVIGLVLASLPVPGQKKRNREEPSSGEQRHGQGTVINLEKDDDGLWR